MIPTKYPSLPKVPDTLPDEESILGYLGKLRSRMLDELSIIRKSLARADANSQTVAEQYNPDEIVQYNLSKRRIESSGYKISDFAPADHDILSATHGDSLVAAVTQGALIYGNATPKWASLAGDNTGTRKYLSCLSNAVSWEPLTITHEMLSATHTDSTAAAVVRGDIIIGSGATPKWTRLAKGTQGAIYNAGADEPQCSTTLTTVDATTNVVTNLYTLDHQSSGTPAAGFGSGLLFQLESDTTASQSAAQIATSWTDATHATRTSKVEIFNVINGNLTGFIHSYGTGNLFVGNNCGNRTLSGADANLGIGSDCLSALTSGDGNVCLGPSAGPAITKGGANFLLGSNCGRQITTGSNNVLIGTNNCFYSGTGIASNIGIGVGAFGGTATNYLTTGLGNIGIGYSSNAQLKGASNFNIAIGHESGAYSEGKTTSFNVCIGFQAGAAETNSNKLIIHSSNPPSSYPLIYGDFGTGVINFSCNDAATNVVTNHVVIRHASTGTVSVGFGGGILGQLESSTTASQDAAQIAWRWRDATHASRTSEIVFSTVSSATTAETQMFTPDGGFAIKLTAGEDLVRGNGVYINPAGAASTVYKTPVDGDMCIGVVYADATSTNPVWVIVSGKAYVLPTSTVSFALGDVIYSSTTEAGRADSSATVPAITTHMREWGHALAASGSNGALTLCVLHFN